MTIVSALSSIATLVAGGVTEDFKSVIRPRSLVAAAIFLALNVVLVLPPLAQNNVKKVLQFAALPIGWQAALLTLKLFILAYLINSLSAFFLTLVSGRFLENSVVFGRLALRYQQYRFDALHQVIRDAQAEPDAKVRDQKVGKAAYRLAFDFPGDREALATTGLGNVLLSTATYTRKQFGAHLDTVLPLLALTLKASNADLEARLRERQESLSFLSGLVVLLLLTAVEVALAAALSTRRFPLLELLALVLPVVPVYLAAIQTARAWGRELRNAFVLYLDEVGKQLGLRELPREALHERRKRWEQLSQWIVFGGLDVDVKDAQGQPKYARPSAKAEWYREMAEPSGLVVSAPPGVRVTATSEPGPEPLVMASSPTRWLVGPVLRYRFVLDHEGAPPVGVSGCYLLVLDSQVPEVPSSVEGVVAGAWRATTGEPLQGTRSTGNTLWWQLGDLPVRGSLLLHYRLPRTELSVEVVAAEARILFLAPVEDGSGNLRLMLETAMGAAPADVTLTLDSPKRRLAPASLTYSVAGGAPRVSPAQQVGGTSRYTLLGIAPQSPIELIIPRPQLIPLERSDAT
ncbi:MAG TPA: hypothetical protein VE153_14240 [Myxococcus sp.]|nr:hypothetical protein [Myxococcus sp.]